MVFIPPTTLIGMISHVLHDGLQATPGLLGCGQDLLGRQEEAVSTRVSQFKGKRVLDARVVGPVNASSTGLV